MMDMTTEMDLVVEVGWTEGAAEAELERLQGLAKAAYAVLQSVAAVQAITGADLGLEVLEADEYAPLRIRLQKSGYQFHPRFGIKRLNGRRIDREIPELQAGLMATEAYFRDLKLPPIEKAAFPLLEKWGFAL
jgi:hypothetical protein